MAPQAKNIDYRLLEDLVAQGKKVSAIAKELGVGGQTYYNRMKRDDEFRAAVERGEARARGEAAAGPAPTTETAPIAGSTEFELTDLDRAIIDAIATKEKYFNADIAAFLKHPAQDVWERLIELEKAGVLRWYERDERKCWFIVGKTDVLPSGPGDDIEAKILAAIDAECCTLPQIKRHAGIAKADDISDVLHGMTDKIVKLNNGTISAYFRVGRQPKRFWSEGDKCGIEWGEASADDAKQRLIREKNAELARAADRREAADTAAKELLSRGGQRPEQITQEPDQSEATIPAKGAAVPSHESEITLPERTASAAAPVEKIARPRVLMNGAVSKPPASGKPRSTLVMALDVGVAPGSRKLMPFTNGASVVVDFDGNFFEASPAERDLLNEIADALQRYQVEVAK
jgi:hypothetical protein